MNSMIYRKISPGTHLIGAGILLLLFLLLTVGCREGEGKSNVSIRVKLKSSNGEMVYLDKVTADGTTRIDSAATDRNGEVTFRLHTADFEFLMITDGLNKSILLLAEKDQDLTVYTTTGIFGDDYSVEGSGGSILLQKLEEANQRTAATLDSLGQVWLRVRHQDDNVQQKEMLDSVADHHLESHRDWLRNFIVQYDESPATIVAAYQTIRHSLPLLTYREDPEIFRGISERMTALFPENPHVIDFHDRHQQFLHANALFEERERKLAPGNPAPPIELFNRQGERVTLESMQGKLVLIHFWDGRKKQSWENHQVLKELYAQYRYRGFEIMGIYYGDDKQLFYDIIAGDDLPWTHLFGNTTVIEQYNVGREPVMILIDREGKILYRGITSGELSRRLPFLLPGTGREVVAPADVSENGYD